MKIKILYPNPNGKLEFTKEELEALLTESYRDGYEDGKQAGSIYYKDTITAPYTISTTPTVVSYGNISSATDKTIAYSKDTGSISISNKDFNLSNTISSSN